MKENQEISNIVKNYVHDQCTRQELEYSISLFEEPYHNMELRPLLYEIWNNDDVAIKSTPGNHEFDELLNQVHHQINLNKKKQKVSKVRQLVIAISKIAAILILGTVIGILLPFFQKNTPVYYTSIAPKGSVSQMVLPDNTVVYLNAGSELKYLVNSKNKYREVFLKGEAWFDVAKSLKKKFIVHTYYYDVNVWGTKFNVKAYPEENIIATTLEEGSVQITSSPKTKLQSDQVLKPGEQLIFDKSANSINLKKVDTKLYSSWKENKLVFINMSLKELIVLIERKYGVEIEVKDNSILNFHYDGTIKNESILEMMNIIQETLPIHFEIQNQKIIINETN